MAIPIKYLDIYCLAVDDEASMRSTIKNMLLKIGFKNVFVSDNGKNAWDHIQTSKVDLVIADVNMPEMSGIELFNTVRAHKKFDKVSFIFVTAEASREMVARVAEKGADEYIIKPFVLGIVEDKIAKTLDKKFSPKPVDVYLKGFKAAMESRDAVTAEEELSKAAELAPENAVILFHFGELSLQKGDVDKAIEYFKAAIDKKPLFVKAYNALGEIYEKTGDMQSAIRYYERAHEISPANTERLISLSKLYTTSGDNEKAETMLKDAISNVREDLSTSSHLIGEMYLSRNETDKALEMLVKAYKQNPHDVAIMQSLAEAYRKAMRQQDAIKIYEDMIRINQNNAAAYYNMGKAYLEMGVKDKAIQAMKKAWELNPFSKEITKDLKALAEKDRFDL